jgi:hypothetical protein
MIQGPSSDGTFVRIEGSVALVVGEHLAEWTHEGYRARRSRPVWEMAEVITPPSTVAALRAGYPVQIDDSAR